MSSSAGEFTHCLRLRTTSAEDAIVIRCARRLRSEHTEQLREEFMRVLPGTKRIVLDLSDLRHMGSTGSAAWCGSMRPPNPQTAIFNS